MTVVMPDCVEVRPGLRERQRRSREQAILDAAFTLIADIGYEATTMEALADRVGLSKPTLYNHFPSKEAIAVRALVRLNEEAVDAIQAIDPDLPPRVRLERYVEWLLQIRFEPRTSAFLRARAALTPARRHPDYIAASTRKFDAVVGLIHAAQTDSAIDRQTAPELLAHTLTGLVCHTDYDDLIADGRMTTADLAAALVRVFFYGVRP